MATAVGCLDGIFEALWFGKLRITDSDAKCITWPNLQWFSPMERRYQEYIGKRKRDLEIRGSKNRRRFEDL